MRGFQTVKPADKETQNEKENNCNAKLSELKMPVFDGDKIKWKQFRDFIYSHSGPE